MSKIKAQRNGTKNDVICRNAAILFRKKGFAATSMRELAEQLGVEAPSLYNHIGSKNELLQNICIKVAEQFSEHMQQIETDETKPLKKLEKLIRFQIQMMLKSFDEVYVANHEWKHLKDPWLKNFLHERKGYENRMVQFIRDGINAKEIRPGVHPQVTVLTILSAVRGLEFWQKYKDQVNTKALEKNIVQQLIKGISI